MSSEQNNEDPSRDQRPTEPRTRLNTLDPRPVIVAQVLGAIEVAIDSEAASIRERLADLGVTVD